MAEINCKPGDWIRHTRNGKLAVSIIQYPGKISSYYPKEAVYMTDDGMVAESNIVECRSKSTDESRGINEDAFTAQ